MRSLVRTSFVAAFTAIIAGANLPPANADDRTGTVQDRFDAAQTLSLASSPKPATEMLRGVVAEVDEGNDTIRIKHRASDASEEFKVQDGLVFNSVRYGDQVEITVENIAGAKTIVGLTKE